MDYKAKFIEGKTSQELVNELKSMQEMQYRYGCSIDRPRMWDINHTLKGMSMNQASV